MITPPYLQKGDTIAIVSTARKNLDTSLKPTTDLLELWGFKWILGKTMGLEYHQLAGTDVQRTADFQEQLDNPKVKAIWCVRGGYGTVKIIDQLDFTSFLKNPKWIIGFSDITVLHSQLNQLGIASIHATMPISIAKASDEAIKTLRDALVGNKFKYTLDANPMNHFGNTTGELVGGNLSILYSLLGSNSAINCDNKILFLEDLDEYLYHIDRMMMNLKRNGCLQNLKGIIVGGMTEMKDNEIPWGKNALEIIDELVKDLNIPVMYNFPAGHISDNRALILGRKVSIEVSASQSTVIFH